ncbi:tyrosine-type recombinase/integrase [Mycobacteroides abscessus]|uniref:tyrosine-type recombinase/integrase n=1 Tax=Mycobacteroides abscessus TaxID=36809 RepID=UPI001EE6C796|nr:tyrosine-type recombinase/integrase [Mycobacteroides abscessus]
MTARATSGPPPLPVPSEWQPLIDRYRLALQAVGYPKTTIGTRMSHMGRIARSMGVPPEAVTDDLLELWFARQTHWAPETRRGYRTSATKFFGWAHAAGHLPIDASAKLPSVKPGVPTPNPAPDRIWKEALLAADPRTTVMLHLACSAGLRRAEVAQVHTEDLREGFSGYQLLVHGKGAKDRLIPISDELAAMILAGPGGHTPGHGNHGFLFPGADGGHLSARWVGKLCAAAMPGVWTMHKLRHRFSTRAYQRTRNLRALQQLLGHASVATTQIYTAVDDDEMRETMLAASDTGPRPWTRWASSAAGVVVAASAATLVNHAVSLVP